eukprot:7260733-Alexandrium_andersonii.AAC.1
MASPTDRSQDGSSAAPLLRSNGRGQLQGQPYPGRHSPGEPPGVARRLQRAAGRNNHGLDLLGISSASSCARACC